MVSLTSIASGFGQGLMGYLGFGGQAFDAGRHDVQEMRGFTPSRAHMDSVFSSQGRLMVDRAEDMDRNSAWINGALDRAVESVIGNGLQPWPTPIYDLLSEAADTKWASKWGRRTRARYRAWAEDPLFRCDAQMRFSVGILTRLAYLNFRRGGEVLVELRKDRRGASNPLNLLLIDPKRLQNPMGTPDSDPKIRNGIERDANGVPVAVHVLKRHPDDPQPGFDGQQTVRVTMRSSTGTPKLIHVLNPRYIEQTRGFSKMAESLLPAKMLERYDRAEINAALLNAIMAVFVEAAGSPEDLAAAIAPGSTASNPFTDYMEMRGENPMASIGEAMVRQLLPGEKVHFTPPAHPNAVYPDFQKAQLSKIATSHGLSHAQISANWEGINYSSARAMLNEIWRGILQERDYFAQNFVHPVYVGWLEEEVAAGTIKVPGGPAKFYTNLSAISNCRWIGPARGTVDPQKEAQANNLDSAAHRVSPIELALERGSDPFDVLDQIAIFKDALDERSLDQPNFNTKASAESSGAEDSAGTEQDRDGDGEPLEAEKKKAKPKQGTGQ